MHYKLGDRSSCVNTTHEQLRKQQFILNAHCGNFEPTLDELLWQAGGPDFTPAKLSQQITEAP